MNKSEQKQTHASPNPRGGQDFEIRPLGDYFVMIRERWLLGVACALLVSCLAGYYLLNQPTVYEAQARLLVERQNERVVDMPQVVNTEMESAGGVWRVLLEDHVNQLTGRSFRQYVIDSLTEEEKEQILAPYLPEDPTENPPSLASILVDMEAENLLSSFMLQVHFRHRDPEVAAMVANRYMERYIDFIGERRGSLNDAAIGFLTEQEKELGEQVAVAEQELQTYRQEHNLVAVEEDQSLIGQRLLALNQGATGTRVDRLELEAQVRQVDYYRETGGNLLELNSIALFAMTQELVANLSQLRRERQALEEKYLDRHPRMVASERAVEEAEKGLQKNIDLAVAEMQVRLKRAQEREETLLTDLHEAEAASLNFDRLTMKYRELERGAESARKTYAQIKERLNQTKVMSQLETSNLRIVDRAVVPRVPVEPNIVKVGALMAVLGGFCFIGAPIGLGTMDRRMKAVADVPQLLGQKLIGEISVVRGVKEKDRPHVVEKELNDHAAEAFRGVFSQLQLNGKNSFPKTLLITSTIPGEGKSFFVSNLGNCFAAHGHRTLIIDFDLRRPTLHRIYGQNNSAGILSWLAAGNPPGADLLENPELGITEVAPGLFLLRAGGQTKKATETINKPAVAALVAALKEQFGLLLIDSPPLGVFPDGLALGQLADEAIYLVRFGKVDRRQVQTFMNRMEETRAELLGVVMNGMPRGRRHAHYSGYAYGNYKYEKYYAKKK